MIPEVESTSSIWFEIIALAFLLYLSGFFSSSETALTSVSKHKIKEHIPNMKDYLKWSNKMLTTILISNNIVNILASSIATILVLDILGPKNAGLSAAIATTVMTILILVFGEITPKIYARENTDQVFKKTIPTIKVLSVIYSPVVKALMVTSNMIIKLLGGKALPDAPFITEEDIVGVVEVGQEAGVVKEEESFIVKRTFDLRKTSVREIMTPRVEIVAVEENDTVSDLIKIVKEEEYSRIPVYRETIDDVVGVCYAKDVLSLMSRRKCEDVKRMRVKDIMRDPLFVPETMKISDLLSELRTKKVHIAIVVDEFGGTAGIVTFEDIIEELIGEIYDEYDQGETIGIKRLEDGSYLIDAMTPLNDIERELGVVFPETEYETLAGYLLEVFQRIPSTGEDVTVGNFYFRIVASGKNRIEKVLMKVIDDEKGRASGNGQEGS